LVTAVLGNLLGAAATWLPLLLFFPLAAFSMSRLIKASLLTRLAAATLYLVNPFVFQRIFVGQIAVLLGYALLPLAVASMVKAVDERGIQRLRPVLWWALLTGIDPHFAWIGGVVLAGVVISHRRRLTTLAWAGVVGLAFLATLAYVFLPHFATRLPVTVGLRSLAAFRTTGSRRLGLLANVAGLYGFWRLGPGPVLPKNLFSGWPLLMLAILVVVVVGAVSAFSPSSPEVPRGSTEQNTDKVFLAKVVVVVGVLGFFLALGSQGPTGPLFSWAYYHVPFFAVMREPEKFSSLLALSYAVCFGWGAERLMSKAAYYQDRLSFGQLATVALALGLPLAYTPTIFDGLAGQISSSTLPTSWHRADRLMGTGQGKLLFLPWHLYMAFPFTDARVVANPAPSSFRRSVIAGDDVQLPNVFSDATDPRSAYLVQLFSRDGGARFDTDVARLGVKYIALAKTVDWQSYLWLEHQPGLQVILDTPSLELWRNSAYHGLGAHGREEVTRLSPVAYRIPPGPAGQVRVAIPYQPGWYIDGRPAQEAPDGVLSVSVGRKGGILRFVPWTLAEWGDLATGLVMVVLVLLVVVDARLPIRRGGLKVFAEGDRTNS
jgi:hypothetical protein